MSNNHQDLGNAALPALRFPQWRAVHSPPTKSAPRPPRELQLAKREGSGRAGSFRHPAQGKSMLNWMLKGQTLPNPNNDGMRWQSEVGQLSDGRSAGLALQAILSLRREAMPERWLCGISGNRLPRILPGIAQPPGNWLSHTASYGARRPAQSPVHCAHPATQERRGEGCGCRYRVLRDFR